VAVEFVVELLELVPAERLEEVVAELLDAPLFDDEEDVAALLLVALFEEVEADERLADEPVSALERLADVVLPVELVVVVRVEPDELTRLTVV